MYILNWKWSGKLVPVGQNEYGEIPEDKLFETYQPTIWTTRSFFVYNKIVLQKG